MPDPIMGDETHVNPGHKGPIPYLHIYPQENYHSEAYIVGNLQGLVCLIKSVAAVLRGAGKKDYCESEVVFCSDGEGYTVDLMRLNDPEPDTNGHINWGQNIALPYPETIDGLSDPKLMFPYELWLNARRGQLNSPDKESDGKADGGVRAVVGGGDSESQVQGQEKPHA